MYSRISRREFLAGSVAAVGSTLALRQLGNHLQLAKGQASLGTPNVLVVVFDTLSAPHMSLYGYPRRTTPNLERFAERATVFHRHYAGGNFTTPGTATILTGTYPWTHRAFNHAGTIAAQFRNQNLFSTFAVKPYYRIAYSHNLLANSLLNQCADHIDLHLPPDRFCLSSGELSVDLFENDADLAWRGFEDLILKRGNEPPSSLFLSLPDRVRIALDKRAGGAPHLDDYPRGVPELFKLTFTLEDVIDGIEDVLTTAPQPFLGYFHLLPPHEPYHPHRDFVGLFDDTWNAEVKPESGFSEGVGQKQLNRFRRQYDEFLLYADYHFGRLLDFLDSTGRREDTIVVFTSDHGQLFERGIHGHVTPALYDPVVKVPLLIALPGQQERQDIHALTSNADLVPTLAHLTDQAADWSDGVVLHPYAPEENNRTIVAMEAKQNQKNFPLQTATLALWSDSYKIIQYLGQSKVDEEIELYDLTQNSDEQVNLVRSHRSTATELVAELKTQLAEINSLYASNNA